jgi:hypothetical protein
VLLLDLGLDESFDASMTSVQATIRNINVSFDNPVCDIDFVRSRDPWTVAAAFTATCDVMHVMSHADHLITPTFYSSDEKTEVSFADLSAWAWDNSGGGIATGTVLADGCKTGTGVWQKAIRDCLEGPITYIGTSAQVGWYESGVFSAAFYSALLRNKGRGKSSQDQAWDAATRAADAYKLLTDRKCPYKAVRLEPSSYARRKKREQS